MVIKVKSYLSRLRIIAGDFVGDDEEKDDDRSLMEALQFMKDSGLVPKGIGKPTKPSTQADHEVAWDRDLDIFYLIVFDKKTSGSVWIIDHQKGVAHFVSSFTGQFKPDPGVKVFKPGRYQDYMSIQGIRTILDIVDPGWDKSNEDIH